MDLLKGVEEGSDQRHHEIPREWRWRSVQPGVRGARIRAGLGTRPGAVALVCLTFLLTTPALAQRGAVDSWSWSERAKLVAAPPSDPIGLAHASSLHGGTALVGAPWEAPGGAAYVFVRSASGWLQQARLEASDAAPGDGFGFSVSLHGDTALIGAIGDDDLGNNSGAAYVFVRSGSTWSQQSKLTAADATGSYFGLAVALFEDTAVVRAPYDLPSPGSAYVFERSGTSWTRQAKLIPGTAVPNDVLGGSIAISANTVLLGADSGSNVPFDVFVFVRSGTSWSEQARLVDFSGLGWYRFGAAVGLSGDTALVGAPRHDNRGAVHVFRRSGSSWSLEGLLIAEDAEADDYFGYSVAIDRDTALIGSPGDGDTGAFAGSAHVFTRSDTTWSQQAKLVPSGTARGDVVGITTALCDDTAVIGASGDDDGGVDAGAAYVFTLDHPEISSVCAGDGTVHPCPCQNESGPGANEGCRNSTGSGAILSACGSAVAARDDLVLLVRRSPPATFGVFFQGGSSIGLPLHDGILCAGGPQRRLGIIRLDDTGTGDSVGISIAAAGGAQPGQTRYYQLWYRDSGAPACGSGANWTSGIQVNWQ